MRAVSIFKDDVVQRVAGVAGAVLVFRGIQYMHDTSNFPLWPAMPTGILSDVFPNPQWVALGTLCSLLGCLLGVLWLPRSLLAGYGPPGSAGPPGAEMAPPASSMRLGRIMPGARGVLLSGAAGLAGSGLYVYALIAAYGHDPSRLAALSLIVAILLFGLTIRGLVAAGDPGPGRRRAGGVTWLDGAIVLAVAAACTAVNAHDLRNWLYAFQGDEWAFYEAARSIAQGNPVDLFSQAGVYGIHPLANSAYQALGMRVLGMSIIGWRMTSILSIVLPLPALYYLARAIGGVALAGATVVFYATCSLLWTFAHIGYNANDPLLAMIPAALLLYRGLRDDRPVALFAAGACAGAGWYLLFTGRLMIGVLVLVALTEWRGGWRAMARRLAFILLGFVLVVLPLVLDNGTDTIHRMFGLVSLSQERTTQSVSSLLLQNSVRALYEFFYATQYAHFFYGEIFDVVSATALAIGFFLTLRHLRALWARLVLIWFAATLGLTTPFYYVPQIADTRVQVVIPAAALLAAVGLCSVVRGLQAIHRKLDAGPIFAIGIAAALSAAVALNCYRFYVTVPPMIPVDTIALTIGALTSGPPDVAVLAGNVSNNNLCPPADGFQIDPGRMLFFQAQRLVPQCPQPVPQSTRPTPEVLILISPQSLAVATDCGLHPQELVRSPSQQTLWGLRLAVAAKPESGYLDRVRTAITQRCPALAALPPA